MNNTRLKLLFVVNSVAGANDVVWQDTISNYFTGKDFAVDFFHLEQKPDIEGLKEQITTSMPDRVIAVGGDGTVGMVAKLVSGTGIPLGILPAGSANGMARELNIPADPEQALNIIENGRISYCDAIRINDKSICLHLADVGLNAQFIKYFDEGNLRGKLGYAKVFFKTLWRSQKFTVSIQSAENNVTTKAFMVVLANASKYGTGAVINPKGKIDDGKFEIVIVRKLSFIEIMKTVFRPDHLDPEKIEVIAVDRVTIKMKRRKYFQVDGEFMGKLTEVRAEILPKYINVLLPDGEG